MTEAEFLDKLQRHLQAMVRLFEELSGRSLGVHIQIVRKDG